jgi:hypothetical protein
MGIPASETQVENHIQNGGKPEEKNGHESQEERFSEGSHEKHQFHRAVKYDKDPKCICPHNEKNDKNIVSCLPGS